MGTRLVYYRLQPLAEPGAVSPGACRQNHFVNPTTGKVLGEDDDE